MRPSFLWLFRAAVGAASGLGPLHADGEALLLNQTSQVLTIYRAPTPNRALEHRSVELLGSVAADQPVVLEARFQPAPGSTLTVNPGATATFRWAGAAPAGSLYHLGIRVGTDGIPCFLAYRPTGSATEGHLVPHQESRIWPRLGVIVKGGQVVQTFLGTEAPKEPGGVEAALQEVDPDLDPLAPPGPHFYTKRRPVPARFIRFIDEAKAEPGEASSSTSSLEPCLPVFVVNLSTVDVWLTLPRGEGSAPGPLFLTQELPAAGSPVLGSWRSASRENPGPLRIPAKATLALALAGPEAKGGPFLLTLTKAGVDQACHVLHAVDGNGKAGLQPMDPADAVLLEESGSPTDLIIIDDTNFKPSAPGTELKAPPPTPRTKE